MNELMQAVREYLNATESTMVYTDRQSHCRTQMRKQLAMLEDEQRAIESSDAQVEVGPTPQRVEERPPSEQPKASGSDNAVGKGKRKGNGKPGPEEV